MKNYDLGSEKIGRLVRHFAVPCVISMLVAALYNIVDQIFIGWSSAGAFGNAATNIVYPFTVLALGLALLVGDGSAAMFSLALGEQNKEKADKSVGTGFSFLIILSVVLFAFGFLFKNQILAVFGANPNEKLCYDFANEYFIVICAGLPFYMIGQGLNGAIRADGSPKFAMTCTLVGAVSNIILDPVFIFVLDMGIKGAAIATVISQILSALLVFYFLHGKSELKVRWLHITEISECTRHARDIISLGSAGFIMQLTNSLVSICCNNVLSVTGGDIYISVMTIVSSVRQMVETPIHAMNEGSSPVLSYNYGARRPDRVKKAGVVLIIMVLVYTGIMWSLILIAPE